MLAAGPPPRLTLNRHCARCGFHAECRQRAVDADDLSLMSGLRACDLAAARRRGIFTVTQLSYAFRARRRRRIRHEWSLQALSIREKDASSRHRRRPVSKRGCARAVPDLEGVPTETCTTSLGYYASANGTTQLSFWAEREEHERVIWQTRSTFSKVCRTTCCSTMEVTRPASSDGWRRDTRPTNRKLSLATRRDERFALIDTAIHFPTLSDGLEDIAGLLGFRWSGPVSTGLECACGGDDGSVKRTRGFEMTSFARIAKIVPHSKRSWMRSTPSATVMT